MNQQNGFAQIQTPDINVIIVFEENLKYAEQQDGVIQALKRGVSIVSTEHLPVECIISK